MTNAEKKRKLAQFIKNNQSYKQRKQSKSQPKQPRRPTVRKSNNTNSANSALEERMNAMERQMTALKSKNRELSAYQASQRKRHDKKVKGQKTIQNNGAISDMESGFDKNRFHKVYHLTYNGHKWDLPIIMRAATLSDENQIASEVTQLTNGYGRYYSAGTYAEIDAVAAMRVLGVEVPKEFKHPEELHRFDILLDVFDDYIKWADNFRGRYKL